MKQVYAKRCSIGLVVAAISLNQSAFAQNYSNNSGGAATFYGQLSPAYLGFDDGSKTFGNVADNSHSNSRVGLFLDQKLSGGQELRFNFEAALGAPQSGGFSQENDPIWEWDKTKLRKLELIWSSNWGTVFAGQGSLATDGTDSMDLSGTTLASGRAVGDSAGSYFFRQDDGELSGVTIGNAFKHYDGARRMRVRYDTPKFGGRSDDTGINFEISYGYEALQDDNDNTYYDVAAYFGEAFSSFDVAAAAGYLWIEGEDDTTENWSASMSALHRPTGLNGSVASGGDPDGGSFLYGKLGWIAEFTDIGGTALSVDYAQGKDSVSSSDNAEMWGIQAVQNFDKLSLEAYTSYAEYSFKDSTGIGYKDMKSVLTGVRWKF
ncbi:porin [Aliiruegeria sabulilitoris]|uniref:porin n=1 Tax=Aliiruegeria sabulilitoris TaxID=1510458 RepID=UPI00082B3C40|nr:porin [Aliiruegeria sabulilitoris]NDR58056.1 porin [Pseudoruegeria sp. M32A2M]